MHAPFPRHVAAMAAAFAIGAARAAWAEERAPNEPREDRGGNALEGIEIGTSLTGVVQQANAAGAEDGMRTSRGSFRGDVALELPAGAWGGAEGKIFTHVRFGQGEGVVLRPTYTSTPNTTAFPRADGSGGAHAIVAQAWYQLTAPLASGGPARDSRDRLELTFGKMDAFLFFDQNAVADDETVRFMNNAFVHSPLLDSGGDTAGDDHGFAPGVRIAYVHEKEESGAWTVSLAAFGSGPGADFHASPDRPFVIGQVETTRQPITGLPGTYRAYAWTNGRTVDFDGEFERHSGFGFSADQRVSEAITLWGRFGRQLDGQVRFDLALTLGAEIRGDSWGRPADAFGLAAGFLRTSPEYRDATADSMLVGYAASGTERIAELYYRWRVNEHLDVTPDLQWIRRPGGDASASDAFVVGVRGRVGF
jgi:hypothetical protein